MKHEAIAYLKRIEISKRRQDSARPFMRNRALERAYSDPDAVKKMLKWIGYDSKTAERALSGKTVPCILRAGKASATVTRGGKRKQFGYLAFRGRRTVWLSLAEVLAAISHGYKWPDRWLVKSPQLLGVYRGLLAVESGVLHIERQPLPLVPRSMAEKITEMEFVYSAVMLQYLSLRMDLARAFTPSAFERSGEKIMFTSSFRRSFIPICFRSLVASRHQQEELWQMLIEAGTIARHPNYLCSIAKNAPRQERFNPLEQIGLLG